MAYHREYYRNNREAFLEYMRKYGQDNKAACYARSRIRKETVRRATPPWVDLNEIIAIYKERDRIPELTGVSHAVDHYIPLRHPLVCGLHVPANLRIITEKENLRKGNKFSIE